MREHKLTRSRARQVVLEGRRQLRMTRKEPWTKELREVCERRLKGKSACDMEPTEKETERVDDTVFVSPNIVQSQENLPKLDVNTWLEKQGIETRPSSTEEESDQSVAKCLGTHLADVDMSVAGRTEAEIIADDCSETSYNTKCFTTAEEVGLDIDVEAAATIIESIERETVKVPEGDEDCSDSSSSSGSSSSSSSSETSSDTEPSKEPVQNPDPPAVVKAPTHPTKEERTVGTSISSDTGIPQVIYIRRGKKEVPDNEPLGECYNIPAHLLPHLKQRRFGEKIVDRLRKITGIGKRNKLRLGEDDTEARRQTLIDV